jgi:hypothetical protein
MTTDEELRELLADVDPAADLHAPDVLDLLDLGESTPRPRRRWVRPALFAAAAVAAFGLVGTAVVPQMLTPQGQSVQAPEQIPMAGPAAQDSAQGSQDPVYLGGPSIIRTATVLSSAGDPAVAAEGFVRTITGLDGRVTSQTVVTEGSAASGTAPEMMPTPYPQGPGVWLTVQVPEGNYEQALAAARDTGQVVRLEQSSEDVSAQVADVDARVRALRSSVTQLRSLMDRATSVSEVIALEQAISDRQSELDGLRAQQRELLTSTRMSEVSLTLMTSEDAAAAVGDTTPSGWTTAGWLLAAALVVAAALVFIQRLRRKHTTRTP